MKIAFVSKKISPEIGGRLAGYGPDDFSVAKRDDLYLTALAMNDGSKTCLMLGYDLLGIDAKYIQIIRRKCADVIGGDEMQVVVSCTHTHCGPHTRTLPSCPDRLETGYLETLIDLTIGAANELLNGEWFDTDVYFYSLSIAAVDPSGNKSGYCCLWYQDQTDYAYLEPLCDGVRDRELGGLVFRDRATGEIRYIVGNYAAHPLAGHTPGTGGHRISADYPGAFRDYLKAEIGCESMFLSGAAGDMVPKGHETGSAAIDGIGVKLAQAAIRGTISAMRAPDSYKLECETLQFGAVHATGRIRRCLEKLPPDYRGQSEIDMEVQLLSVGDVCLVGMPGEALAELGLEIKWHSPFRKTFILYCSTAYLDYLCHGNALTQGGYEARNQFFDSRAGLALVNAAVDGCHMLYERTFPDRSQWPENNYLPMVSFENRR